MKPPRRAIVAGAALLLATGIWGTVTYRDLGPVAPQAPGYSLPVPTLGGRQLWSDVTLLAGWRIQENALNGDFRLLDDNNLRRASGSYEDCAEALAAYTRREGLAFPERHVVLLLHGLGRPRTSMETPAKALREAGYAAYTVGYASTRLDLAAHAERLNRLIASMEGVESVSFVTHSLGGLVVRTALARDDWPAGIEPRGLVMLAPPSTGAELADRMEAFTPFRVIAGPVSAEINSEGAAQVPLPQIRHCIVAGGLGDGKGYNPLIEGDDDGIVGVEEARLPGDDDFLVIESIHTIIMDHADAIAAAKRLLAGGRCDDI